MANKEATVYIVDVAKSMGRTRQGRTETDLEWAMKYVWDKITTIVALERKTALQSVIALRSNDTANELGSDESFEHISVLQDLHAMTLTDLQRLRHSLKPSNTNDGDAVSAIVVAIQLITKTCKKLKYKRKIVLVTNGEGGIDSDDMEQIVIKLSEDGIELIVLGVDFDDPDYGFKEENKVSWKADNEATFKSLCEDCDGTFGTLAEAIDELGMPRLKFTRPTPSFKDEIRLGGAADPETTMRINVERYPRTMARKPATASAFVQHDATNQASGESADTLMPDADGEPPSTSNLAAVRSNRIYEVDDGEGFGGKKEVPADELAKGYEYGRTAVHIEEADWGVTKLDTQLGLEILGFIPNDNYDQFMGLSRTNVIVGQKGNTLAAMALSSLVHALAELESFAVARLVTKQDKPPLLVLLAPSLEPEYECLIDVELPFAEDVRSYKFPSLDKVITVSGKELNQSRLLPSDELKKLMSDYVDAMDLSTVGTDDEGNPSEYLTFGDAFSPVLHRVNQGVRFRAINPTEPIPPPYEILTKYSKPPQELANAAKSHLDKLIAKADVKKAPAKAQSHSRRRNRDEVKTASGLDVKKILTRTSKPTVSADQPIPSFRQMLDDTDDPNGMNAAVDQLGAIIEKRVKDSYGDQAYDRAVEEMRVMRQEMDAMEAWDIWNNWIKGFKDKLLKEELGGDRRELWWKIRKEKLGLLEKAATEQEAKEFLATK